MSTILYVSCVIAIVNNRMGYVFILCYSSVYWVKLQDIEGSYMILRYAVFMLTLNLQAESINKSRYSKSAQS